MARFSSGVVRRISVTWRSQVLPTMVTTGVPASSSILSWASCAARDAGAAGRAKGGHAGVVEFQLPHLVEKGDVARVGAGEAALDVVDAELVEPLGDEQFVGRPRSEMPSPCVPSRSVVS